MFVNMASKRKRDQKHEYWKRYIDAFIMLACRFNKWLVRKVTMSVSAGEIVTLIGPNGSGKSTTKNITGHHDAQ